MAKPVSFAVAGCGSIGERHLAVLDDEPMASIAAVCDTDEEKSRKLSGVYGDAPWFTDYDEMLASVNADVIDICTPHDLHAPMAVAAAAKGRHILVEKPMALTRADCGRMIKAADAANVKLFVVKQNRYNIPVRLAKEALDKGALGKIYMSKCDILWNRRQDYYSGSAWRGRKSREGGALFTLASHFIDLLTWWFGNVTNAVVMMDNKGHDIEIEDCGTAVLSFDSGVMGSIVWTTCVFSKNYEGSITIIGEKGTIKIGGKYLNTIEYWEVENNPLPEGISFTDKPNLYKNYQGTSSNHDKVIKAMISAVSGWKPEGEELYVGAEGTEGLKSVEAIEKIYQKVEPWNPRSGKRESAM